MEACASAHHWAREISKFGHEVRLIPPAYVKPFVKRQNTDMADAEAIREAAQRPTMRFVQPKTAEAQRAAVIFRARDLLVRQRIRQINALRVHLVEFGFVVRKGASSFGQLIMPCRGSCVRDTARRTAGAGRDRRQSSNASGQDRGSGS
jgi:transposase